MKFDSKIKKTASGLFDPDYFTDKIIRDKVIDFFSHGSSYYTDQAVNAICRYANFRYGGENKKKLLIVLINVLMTF